MISIKDFMEAIEYRISEGDKYLWSCYGDNAFTFDSWNGDHNSHSVSITFDTKTQEVYSAVVCDYKNDRAYRLLNPDFKQDYYDEAKERNVNPDQAWDDVNYVDLDVDEDFLEKARAIINGETYPTEVMVEVNLDKDVLLEAALAAHKRGITLNQYCVEAVDWMVKEVESGRLNLEKKDCE